MDDRQIREKYHEMVNTPERMKVRNFLMKTETFLSTLAFSRTSEKIKGLLKEIEEINILLNNSIHI